VTIKTFFKNLMRPMLDHYPELRDARSWEEHVAAGLRLELKHCPVCNGPWSDHSYASIASIRIGTNQVAAAQFSESARAHRWDEIVKHQRGQQKPDNAELCVIRCSDGKCAQLLVHTPFEPWDYKSIDYCEVLDSQETQDLQPMIAPTKWVPLNIIEPSHEMAV
jgi:hypothetical protein